jgi:hypothetical protein
MAASSASVTFILFGSWQVELGVDLQPVVVVAAIRLMLTSRVSTGVPRQLRLMTLNSRVRSLFHLLVPGGKWQTWIWRPVRSANFCSSTFHGFVRLPLEPPQSAVIVSVLAFG